MQFISTQFMKLNILKKSHEDADCIWFDFISVTDDLILIYYTTSKPISQGHSHTLTIFKQPLNLAQNTMQEQGF